MIYAAIAYILKIEQKGNGCNRTLKSVGLSTNTGCNEFGEDDSPFLEQLRHAMFF